MTRLLGAISSIALLLMTSTTGKAQPRALASAAAGTPRITLSITTNHDTYKVGEKVLVNIFVRNSSDEEYCENHFLETGEADINGYHPVVLGPNGEELLLIARVKERGMRSRGKLCIGPGETLRESLYLNQLVDLSAAGVFQIAIDHLDRENDVRARSNLITFTISR
jgi:hypothetical protein